MMAWQLVVMVSASSNVMFNACMCDSFLGLMPHVASKSNWMLLASDDLSYNFDPLSNQTQYMMAAATT